jgi:hypothetical protein
MSNNNLMTAGSLIELLKQFPPDSIINLGVQRSAGSRSVITYEGLSEAKIDYRPSLNSIDFVTWGE